MNPDFLGARLVLWWVHVARGALEEAIADIQREMEKPGLKTVKKLMLAYACAAAGRQGGGQRAALGARGQARRARTGWRCCRRCCSRRWT